MEGLYYLCGENKGADQLRGYREADLRLCFRICKNRFSNDAAHIVSSIRAIGILICDQHVYHDDFTYYSLKSTDRNVHDPC